MLEFARCHEMVRRSKGTLHELVVTSPRRLRHPFSDPEAQSQSREGAEYNREGHWATWRKNRFFLCQNPSMLEFARCHEMERHSKGTLHELVVTSLPQLRHPIQRHAILKIYFTVLFVYQELAMASLVLAVPVSPKLSTPV